MSAPSSLGAAVKLYRIFPPTKCLLQTYRNIFAWRAACFLRIHFSVVGSVNRAVCSHVTSVRRAAVVSDYFIISFRQHILRCSSFCSTGKRAICSVGRLSEPAVRTNYLADIMCCEYSSQKGEVKEELKTGKKQEEIQEVIHEKRKRIKESGQLLLKEIRERHEKMKERMEEVVETENVWTIPNLLCVMRIGVSPLLGYLILQSNYTVALGLLGLAGISDLKTLSRYFDVTHATAQLAPTTISKVNTAVQLLLVATTLAAPVFNYVDHQALHVLWYITAGTTVTSAISYLVSKNTYKYLKTNK